MVRTKIGLGVVFTSRLRRGQFTATAVEGGVISTARLGSMKDPGERTKVEVKFAEFVARILKERRSTDGISFGRLWWQ